MTKSRDLEEIEAIRDSQPKGGFPCTQSEIEKITDWETCHADVKYHSYEDCDKSINFYFLDSGLPRHKWQGMTFVAGITVEVERRAELVTVRVYHDEKQVSSMPASIR